MRLKYFLLLVMTIVLGLFTLISVEKSAASTVMGGNDLIARPNVDSATGVVFFDLNGPIQFNGIVTSWNIYALQSGGSIQLLIYQDAGPGQWSYVGGSGLENVSSIGINIFTLSSPISVSAGDYLAFWYPQNTTPSVAFSSVGASVNNHNWNTEPITDLSNFMGVIPDMSNAPLYWLDTWDKNSRTYSINVTGSPVPIPGTVLLLGSGLLGLGGWRRFRKS